MLFDSLAFAAFFLIVILAYGVLPKLRHSVLLLASYVFYAWWDWHYLPLLIGSTLVAYYGAIWIEKTESPLKKKQILQLLVVFNILVLCSFKYFNFFGQQINSLLSIFKLDYLLPYSKLILPLGISFFTFQAMAYITDVYRKEISAEKSLFKFALFKAFFPQLIAGPILRAKNLFPQLEKLFSIQKNNLVEGSVRFLFGLAKKVVISNRLAVFVNQVYNAPESYDGFVLILATLFFAIQIYCDFSGYTDMAIGLARIFNIKFEENFLTPYFSKNVKEFWSRWHISLSTWFKDYLYIPLGGNRKRMYLNLFIVFLISGLWHGASWNFIIWGAIHGIFLLIITFQTKNNYLIFNKLPSIIQILFTFSIVCFAWIFFRANSIQDSFYIIKSLSNWHPTYWKDILYQIKEAIILPEKLSHALNLDYGKIYFQTSTLDLILSIIFISLLICYEYFWVKKEKSIFQNYVSMSVLFLIILWFGSFNQVQFIYFQF